REHEFLGKIFNDWKMSGVVTVGSGRPVDSRVAGDPNQDGNDMNDRLTGLGRNAFLGPDYATTDLRLTRRIYAGDRIKLELMAESFNLLNRDNKRVGISDVGFLNSVGQFVQYDKTLGINHLPTYYAYPKRFMRENYVFASRQVQLRL